MKRRGHGLQPIAVAGWSQLLGGVAVLPLALASPVHGQITSAIVVNLLLLAFSVQRGRLRALFPADRRHRADARHDGHLPDAGIRHAAGDGSSSMRQSRCRCSSAPC